MQRLRQIWSTSERLRQLVWALGIALVLGASTFLRPLDIAVWSIQSKMFSFAPSGEIVFVGVPNAERSRESSTNATLARAIDNLGEAGAEGIFIDVPLYAGESRQSDGQLANAIARNADRIVFTAKSADRLDRAPAVLGADPRYFAPGVRTVSSEREYDFLGFTWELEREPLTGKTYLPSLAYALAAREEGRQRIFVDYSIDAAQIPRLSSAQVTSGSAALVPIVAGKRVVIGDNLTVAEAPTGYVPTSLVHIIGAETIIRGVGMPLRWPASTALVLAALMLASAQRGKRRPALYAAIGILWLAQIPLFAYFGVRCVYSVSLALIVVYAVMRGFSHFKRRHLLVSRASGLPNFVAMEQDVAEARVALCHVVVVKILRIEAISSLITAAEKVEYIQQIAKRVRAVDGGASVYYDGGKYLATVIDTADCADLEAHLSGLRALICQPVTVGEAAFDVSATIGASCQTGIDFGIKLNSAIDAADRAEEAYHPIEIVRDRAVADLTWDYSLQAKLDGALENDQISVLLQPQVDLASGLIVGAEALARWLDETGNQVSPTLFIGQSEKVGRLDAITRRIVAKSFEAIASLGDTAPDFSISINVSAIQLVDDRILHIVRDAFARWPVEPHRVVLEITETARIEDFNLAARLVATVKALGVKVALDDFGVGAANLEAFLKLPVDEIKIDRLFVANMRRSEKARSVVANTISLAHDAALRCVAEGIESVEQYDSLRNMGCEGGQGFYISRPVTPEDMAEILQTQTDSGTGRTIYS